MFLQLTGEHAVTWMAAAGSCRMVAASAALLTYAADHYCFGERRYKSKEGSLKLIGLKHITPTAVFTRTTTGALAGLSSKQVKKILPSQCSASICDLR